MIAGKYRLERQLAEGGMGQVWHGYNLDLDLPVAVKLLRSDADTQALQERLRMEARAAAKLVHPSIVRVLDAGETEQGQPFIVMELLNGESLSQLIDRAALPPIVAVQLLLPIAEALSLAHSRGIVHRDLKPDNIFMAREGDDLQPKLLDFGIAKLAGERPVDPSKPPPAGPVLGSPDYMSPEQARGALDIDPRSDVWSFCVVLYEAVTGHSPFASLTCGDTLRRVLRETPMAPERLCSVDAQLSGLILSGLAKDRRQRPASIFELGRALAIWLQAQGFNEDATGASLEAKWLARPSAQLQLRTHGPSTPRAQHQHATLVSLAAPRPPSPSPLRRYRWLSHLLIVLAAICGGWLALASRGHLRQADASDARPASHTERAVAKSAALRRARASWPSQAPQALPEPCCRERPTSVVLNAQ